MLPGDEPDAGPPQDRRAGLGFAARRRRARVLAAVERLARGEAVTAVALDLGYHSVSAFIATSRRETGSTPGRWEPGTAPESGR